MAQLITYTCDRCGVPVENGHLPVNAILITQAQPVNREKLDLCYACAARLATLNREFLDDADRE